MPAVKTKRISTLIESQLPEFISTEYELFSKFVTKYYEQQEVQGGTLDVINNIQKYADIDYYEQNLLKQSDVLDVSISDTDDTIVLQDATSFPEKNGYIRIDNEIIFYESRTGTTLSGAVRGVSGNTTLGDLYQSSGYTSTDAAPHSSGQKVLNVSNLFLYALVKNFENQYLGSFPEKYLKGEVDKRTLIKNIQKFYKAKGTTSSIKFVFNTIVAKEADNKPEVYKPKDFTYKASDSDWVNVYALKCKLVSGDVNSLIGKKIVQEATAEYGYADATVDNVYADGTADNEVIYNIVLAPETVNGEFAISTKTKLEKAVAGTDSTGNRINVSSTLGWEKTGSILIGNETITFEEKTVTQFIIKDRQPSGAIPYSEGTSVYKPVTIANSDVTLLTFGVVYNFSTESGQPYSSVGDKVQVSNPGFETADTKIVQTNSNQTRWLLNSGIAPVIPTLPSVQSSLSELTTDVSSIFADEQYYYITSSSFPSYKILDGSTVNEELLDQKILRIIRKEATRTTEKYPTPRRDVGILLNGVPVYSFKDHDSIRFGKLEEIKINTQGRGYAKPPFVLIDQVPNKARAVLTGQVVERIIVDTQDVFPKTPEITITSGRNASVRAIVTRGKVTSLVIDNAGEFYSSPPLVRITDNAGRGRFANYNAIVNTDGNITGFEKIDEGNFYNQNTVKVDIIPVGEDATGIPLLKEWNFNRFKKLENELDTEYGYIFQNYNNVLQYGYGHVANPKALRVALNDNINNAGTEPAEKTHSPIVGFAYDGNPIYGAFGYENPLDSSSSIVRMTSSYSLNGTRKEGPSLSKYPLGSFNNDYTYTHKSGTLDQNNGRFCITPDFPQGTYAYFITIDSNQVPQYPYVLGENFYSLPVDSNYNSNINQDDIPKNSKKYYIAGMQGNGEGVIASINEVQSGTVDAIDVTRTSKNFSINSQVYFDNEGTEGSEVEYIISSVKGNDVNFLECKENKVVKLTTIQNAYLFADDTLTQPSSGAFGSIVGTVRNDNTIVLRNVNGTFDQTGTFSASIKTFLILLDQRSSYTKGATLSLTDGVNAPIATAEVLEGTTSQNTVQIKVLTGTWIVDDNYFLQSSNLFNTSGTKVVTLTSLSDGLIPFEVNQSVALMETATPHGLGIGDQVTVGISPDDSTTTKTYYIRKRLYQEAILIPPNNKTSINFTGIGRYDILNGGADYTAGTYTSVNLTGGSGTGATATFTVSDAGIVSGIQIQDAGSGYERGDYLSVADEDLVRSGASQSTARFTIYVGHVGVPAGGTKVTVDDALGFAANDLIKIGEEILKIESINGKDLIVSRGKEGTTDVDHFDGQEVSLYNAQYNFTNNYQIFAGANSGYIQSYDPVTQKIIIVYDYGTLVSTANEVALSSSFFDSSTPQRLVAIKSADALINKFEFSEDNSTFVPNPNIDLQEFYKYKFDTSHSSLTGTYFDISPSNNFNLITVEKTESTILPGNAGSFTDVKFGFGSRLASNTYQTKTGTDFTNFYYFDRKNVVNSGGSYFKIVTDPLQGIKTLNYVTANRFVYDVVSEPLWDGSGSISYTTTGQFAVGEIDEFSVINLGLNYKKVPTIIGVDVSESFRASATVLFDTATKTITGVRVDKKGSNYVNPKVVITNGDGVNASFNIVVRNGEIFSLVLDKPGRGYTFAPEIQIIEGDVEAYATSNSIGVPKSIKITKNGGSFHLDKTVSSTFTSNNILTVEPVLKVTGLKLTVKKPSQLTGQAYWNTPTEIGPFVKGEEIYQKYLNINEGTSTETATAIVKDWDGDTLIVEVLSGEFVYEPNDPDWEFGLAEIYSRTGYSVSPGGPSGNLAQYPNRAIIIAEPENVTSLELPHYRKGEIVNQKINGVEVARAKVSEWRDGSNLLKVEDVTGTIRKNVAITSILNQNVTSRVTGIFVTLFDEQISSFYDNLGFYQSDKGKLGVSNQKLTDSFFYQDYSYVVKSKTSIEQWRDLIKSTTHPAGFKLFGQVDVESTASSEMPVEVPKASHFSVIQLWNPDKNKITVESTKYAITQSVQSVKSQRIRKGIGSAATSEFLFNEVRAFEFTLDAPFDGYYDTDGKLQGTTQFQLLNEQGVNFFPASEKGLIVTLDGVIQEPGVSYTIDQDTIIFAEPPLGNGAKLTGDSGETTPYKGVTFYGKVFQFKDDQYNTKHLRKIRNIFQRGGTWIDAANQIERNVDFIVNETIGYAKGAYGSLDWSTKQDDYERNIRAILDAYQHDIRFGGNVKTIDYTSIFNSDSEYLYIQNNRTESDKIFAYATRLARLAIRNWDYTDAGVSYFAGGNTMTLTSTKDVAVGMFVSSGRAYVSGTKILSIDSETQITLSSVALANSAGGGGAPQGITELSGTGVTGPIATSTGAVVPPNEFDVPPGVIVTVPTSFSGNDQATFSWSGINNGTFYDAGNLITLNRDYIIQESLTWAQSQYPSLNWGTIETKCGRDIGLILDAYVYSLKFGGNEKIVEAAQLYYQKKDYPYGEELYYITGSLTETVATFQYAKDLMIQAMRNELPNKDLNVIEDSESPTCAEVAAALNTYHDIVNTILTEGRGLVEKTTQNPNKAGYYTPTLTYSNYNILGDPLLPEQECNTVISTIDSLYDNVSEILDKKSVTRTLPDYIDGENKEFELYWDDGAEVNTEKDENLFLTLNAVLQKPKLREDYPLEDAYFIDRTVIPNVVKFDVAPIWDQDLGAKTIGEPTAVEKVSGIGVGNYKRLTIDYNLVDGVKNGPFLILDVDDYTVQTIEAEDALYVFLDGVLQRKDYSYTVSGPNIFFNVPIKKEMKIDMRYLYGRDVGQIINFYDFSPDTYFATGLLSFDSTDAIWDEYSKYAWMGDKIGLPVHAWQVKPDGTYNVIGRVRNYTNTGTQIKFDIPQAQNSSILAGVDIIFGVASYYDTNITIPASAFTNPTLTLNKDEDGRNLLKADIQAWSGTVIGKTYKNPFLPLSNGDRIRVDGEDGFRKIKNLPGVTISKDGRDGEQLSDDIFGAVSVETYTGITRGEGLSVIATIENGTVTKLTWNQRSYEPITQPTAYQYFTPPILKFESLDGNGGGARANVLVSKGQVISVDLIDGGSGYTKAPKVITTRQYDVLSDRGIGVSKIKIFYRPYINVAQSGLVISTIDVLGNRLAGATSFTSVDLLSPASVDRKIIAEIQIDKRNIADGQLGFDMPIGQDQPGNANIVFIEPEPVTIEGVGGVLRLQGSETVVTAEIQDIISTTSISSVTKAITAIQQIEIPNNALSNINYFENAAYLDVDFNIGDSIAYIPDTSKFYGTGLLLVGDEVVRYNRKLSDRFTNITRARRGTTQKDWVAGTFLRQIPEMVSVAPVGIAKIESESQLVAVSVGAQGTGRTEKKSQYQVVVDQFENVVTREIEVDLEAQLEVDSISTIITQVTRIPPTSIPSILSTIVTSHNQTIVTNTVQTIQTEFVMQKNQLEVLVFTPPSGVIDGYQESLFISDPLDIRAGNTTGGHDGNVELDQIDGRYYVVLRNTSNVFVDNAVFGQGSEYFGNYTKTNAGHRISHFEGIFDDGTAKVSGLSLAELDLYFASLTIEDFTERRNSSYTLAGDKFNLLNPSIQNPVAICSMNNSIAATITVQDTTYFPDEGYIFHRSNNYAGVFQYTGKTATSFTGCTIYTGDNQIEIGSELVPFAI